MSRHLQFILSSFIFVILYSSCSFQPNELKIAEELMESAPDSALHILQNLSPDNYSSDENRALYGLLMVQALDKKMLPLKPDSLLDFSIAYYQNYPDNDRLATCYLYQGRIYKYNFQYEKAVNCYLKALDAVKIKDNYLLLGRINSDIADIYLYQQEYKLANQKYFEAYNYFRKAKQTSSAHYSLINIGKSHTQAKSYKNATPYFQKVYRESNDSMVIALALQHIGVNYYESKQFDSALVYFREVIHYPQIKNNRAIRYYYLSDLFLDLEQFDSAFVYAHKAIISQPDIRTERECYRILTNCESSKGNISELNRYMSLYQDFSDSIRKIDAQTKGSYIETMYTTQKEVVSVKSRVWYLFVTILLIIGLSVLLYMQLHKRKGRELNETIAKHKEQKELLQKEMMVKHRQALLQQLEVTKTKQSELRKKLTAVQREALDIQLFNELLHFNDTEFFFLQMDAILNNLATKLKSRYIGISDREISWCCLTLLNIPTTDILVLLNYKVETQNKMKQRLALKIELNHASEITHFLNAVLLEE